MNKLWTVSIKTSLPDVCRDESDLKEDAEMYLSFEEARTGFFEAIKKYAFEDNVMFDGNAYLKEFDTYIDFMLQDETLENRDEMRNDLYSIRALFRKIIIGEEVSESIVKDTSFYDGMISAGCEEGAFFIRGAGDGPINGINANIQTNAFKMDDEKEHYYLYIDDFFGGLWDQGISSELYIDLFIPSFRYHPDEKE